MNTAHEKLTLNIVFVHHVDIIAFDPSYSGIRSFSQITRLVTNLIQINDQRRKVSIAFNAVDMDLRIKGSEIWTEEQGLESGV